MSAIRTITRADLADSLQRKGALSRQEAAEFLEAVLDQIEAAIIRGEHVKISRFGNFVVRDKRERLGRNPKTGQEVPITPRRVVTFRASQVLRTRVAEAGVKPKAGARGRAGSKAVARADAPARPAAKAAGAAKGKGAAEKPAPAKSAAKSKPKSKP